MPPLHAGFERPSEPQYRCLHQVLQAQAERIPDAPAISAPGRLSLTYRRLWQQVDDVVRTLRTCGLRRHDRIAVVLPYGPEMAVALLAVTTGAIGAPLNADLGAHEMRYPFNCTTRERINRTGGYCLADPTYRPGTGYPDDRPLASVWAWCRAFQP